MAMQNRFLILTGGPGTGKTHTTKTIISNWRRYLGVQNIAIACPTARAAQRLADMEGTGTTVQTIHRLLEYDMSIMRFKRDERNRLDELDALVVDEVSMLDLQLANRYSQLYQRVAGYFW